MIGKALFKIVPIPCIEVSIHIGTVTAAAIIAAAIAVIAEEIPRPSGRGGRKAVSRRSASREV